MCRFQRGEISRRLVFVSSRRVGGRQKPLQQKKRVSEGIAAVPLHRETNGWSLIYPRPSELCLLSTLRVNGGGKEVVAVVGEREEQE